MLFSWSLLLARRLLFPFCWMDNANVTMRAKRGERKNEGGAGGDGREEREENFERGKNGAAFRGYLCVRRGLLGQLRRGSMLSGCDILEILPIPLS